jgi:hypothetical protein
MPAWGVFVGHDLALPVLGGVGRAGIGDGLGVGEGTVAVGFGGAEIQFLFHVVGLLGSSATRQMMAAMAAAMVMAIFRISSISVVLSVPPDRLAFGKAQACRWKIQKTGSANTGDWLRYGGPCKKCSGVQWPGGAGLPTAA